MIQSGSSVPTILVANDHEWTARSIETILSAEGYRVERAFTGKQALDRASQVRPDSFVLDVQLPDIDGMSLCRAIRSEPGFGPAVPVFLTTAGPSGRAERLAAYRAGAWEFFGQPLDGETLLLKMQVYLEAKGVVEDLRRDSLVDEATGLYSRRGLMRRGRELIAEAARREGAVTCLILRPEMPEMEAAVATAELLAREIGDFLRASGRSADPIGRVGILDFGVIVSGAGESEVRQLVRRFNANAATSTLKAGAGGEPFAFRAAFCSIPNAAIDGFDLDAMMAKAMDAVGAAAVDPLIVAPD